VGWFCWCGTYFDFSFCLTHRCSWQFPQFVFQTKWAHQSGCPLSSLYLKMVNRLSVQTILGVFNLRWWTVSKILAMSGSFSVRLVIQDFWVLTIHVQTDPLSYVSFYYQLLHNKFIHSYMFRLTISAVIRESSYVDISSVYRVSEW
jgi:hypothetical protein